MIGLRTVLIVCSVVLFAIASAGVRTVQLTAAGLGVFASSFLVP